jgi:hypothetical protein
MMGTRQAARIIRELQHTNLFLMPARTLKRVAVFHHLGAVARCALETQPVRIALLHGRAAEWLSHNGYVDAAVEHARTAGDSHRAAALAQASWVQYLDFWTWRAPYCWFEHEILNALPKTPIRLVPAAGWPHCPAHRRNAPTL